MLLSLLIRFRRRKEQRNGANGRFTYVTGLPLSCFLLHFDTLGLTLSIVSGILVISIR